MKLSATKRALGMQDEFCLLIRGGNSAETLDTALSLAGTSAGSFAADHGDTAVKSVIQQFQQALQRRDVAAIEALVSPDVVVLENGHRNQGWPDFRDNN